MVIKCYFPWSLSKICKTQLVTEHDQSAESEANLIHYVTTTQIWATFITNGWAESKQTRPEVSVSLILAMKKTYQYATFTHPTLVSACTHESLSNLSCVSWITVWQMMLSLGLQNSFLPAWVMTHEPCHRWVEARSLFTSWDVTISHLGHNLPLMTIAECLIQALFYINCLRICSVII